MFFDSDGVCPACHHPPRDSHDAKVPELASTQHRNESRGRLLRGAAVAFYWLYFLFSLVCYVGGDPGLFGPRSLSIGREGFFIFSPLLIIARIFDIKGRRLGAPMATEILKRDHRRPVLYLRAFRDDLFRSTGTPSLVGYIFWDPTVEEKLALKMRGVGPFVAIGKPGEHLPQLGAARMYVPDS